jgi:hypothetical protein
MRQYIVPNMLLWGRKNMRNSISHPLSDSAAETMDKILVDFNIQ